MALLTAPGASQRHIQELTQALLHMAHANVKEQQLRIQAEEQLSAYEAVHVHCGQR